jgi:hypothetical protein
VEVATSTVNARKRARKIQHRLAAIVSGQKGRKPHPSNYRGCSHAKEEICRRKIPRPPKSNTGRAFSSKYITPGVSFAEALQSKADQTQQSHPRQDAAAAPATVDQPRVQTSPKWQKADQSAPAQLVRVVTVVQQFMTEYNDAVSKGGNIQAISKIVLTLPEQNGK